MTDYFIETSPYEDISNTNLLIKRDDQGLFKYDPISSKWITDKNLGIIYTDHIEVETVTEEEAQKVIARLNEEYKKGTYKERRFS